MKIITKFILVIFLCLTISVPVALPKSINNNQEKFGFDLYSSYLSSSLYPEIKTCLKSYNKYLSKNEANFLSRKVYLLIVNHLNKNPIPVLEPPTVHIYKLESKQNVAFILQIQINFLDEEESIEDLVIKLKMRKVFLIFFDKKKTGVKI